MDKEMLDTISRNNANLVTDALLKTVKMFMDDEISTTDLMERIVLIHQFHKACTPVEDMSFSMIHKDIL